jgi:hypothetical protein
MSKPDTSRAAVQTLASHWHGEYIYDLLNALVDERDAAIAASRKVSRKAGEWRDIAKRKDVVIKQLRAKLCAAFLDRLAANDSPLLDAEAAYQATRRARGQDGGQDQ